MTLSESELFTGDTLNENHFPAPVISVAQQNVSS